LTEKEISESGKKGHAAWLASGLKIQEAQYGIGSFLSKTYNFYIHQICRLSLQALVRKIGSHSTLSQKRDVALKRSQLQDKVDAFQKQARSMLHAISNDADDSWGDDDTREIYTGAEFDSVGEDKDNNRLDLAAKEQDQTQLLPSGSCMDAENISLHLPSHLGCSWYDNNAAEDLAKAELHLWEGQLNDSLHQIHIALGHKSYIFRNDVHPACTQRLKTHAWGEVHAIESTVQHHAQVYNST